MTRGTTVAGNCRYENAQEDVGKEGGTFVFFTRAGLTGCAEEEKTTLSGAYKKSEGAAIMLACETREQGHCPQWRLY